MTHTYSLPPSETYGTHSFATLVSEPRIAMPSAPTSTPTPVMPIYMSPTVPYMAYVWPTEQSKQVESETQAHQTARQVYVQLVCIEGKPFIWYADDPTKVYPAFISQNSYYGQPRTLS